MSIKIIITSPASLTKREIDDLRDYLLIAASGAITEPNDLLPTLADVTKEAPKSRKKRTVKESVEPVAPPAPPMHVEQVSDVTIVLPDELPAHGYKYEVSTDITHDELVAWVLENVREMRLNFDNVLEVVTSFGIPTLSLIGLKEHPELITPAYVKFKNLVDN